MLPASDGETELRLLACRYDWHLDCDYFNVHVFVARIVSLIFKKQ